MTMSPSASLASSTSQSTIDALRDTLTNKAGDVPLHVRFRALFTLKAVGDDRAAAAIAAAFTDDSALLKHELAYVLGQMRLPSSLPVLSRVLQRASEDPMVRHEAAEALGAISDPSSLPLLRRYAGPGEEERAVRETCEIACAKIEWDHSDEGRAFRSSSSSSSPFGSEDPAPPTSAQEGEDVPALRAQLLDTQKPLFERYRAMFRLRDIGSPEAVEALGSGFGDDSALFKHELAFVLGQLSLPLSTPLLLPVLSSPSQDPMVRHEAAEALGSIATPSVLSALREWASRADAPRVVRESCVVALDMWEWENSREEFQYADGLGRGVGVGGEGA